MKPLPQPVRNTRGVTTPSPGVTEVQHSPGRIELVELTTPGTRASLITEMNASRQYASPVPTRPIYGSGRHRLAMYYDTDDSAMEGDLQLPDAYAIVVSSVIREQSIHEIYNVARRATGPSGSALKLAEFFTKRFLQIEEGRNPFVWIGVPEQDNELIKEIYSPVGFVFPKLYPNVSLYDDTTPSGFKPGFTFYSGYSCPVIDEYISSAFFKGVVVTIPDNVVIPKIGSSGENFGLINEGVLDKEMSGLLVGTDVLKEVPNSKRMGCMVNKGPCFTDYPDHRPSLGAGYVIAYHTHPFSCHREYGLISGFPSTQDYGSYLQSANERDGDIVFAREGVFLYQLNPFARFLLFNNYIPLPDAATLNAFIIASERIQADRTGIDPSTTALAAKYKSGQALTPDEIASVYTNDPRAIEQVISKMSALAYFPIGLMPVQLLWLQVSMRGTTPTKFGLPSRPMVVRPSGGGRRKTRRRKSTASSLPSGPKRSGPSAASRRWRSGRRTRAYSKRKAGY